MLLKKWYNNGNESVLGGEQMNESILNKFIEYIQKEFTLSVLVCLGILAPGILEVFVFDNELFKELELIKLLILSCSLSSLSMSCFYVFFRVFDRDNTEIKKGISLSLAANGSIIILGLGLKTIGWLISSISHFIIFMIVSLIIWICILFKNRETCGR